MNYKRLESIAKAMTDASSFSCTKRCHHYSFVIYKKRILAVGLNKQKTHPTNLKNRKISTRTGEDFSEFKHICSEFSAITKLKKLTNIDTKKCVLINLRYDRNKKIALAKPCMSCQSLLNTYTFKKVLWTNNTGVYCE